MTIERTQHPRVGEVAVIFVSQSTGADEQSYAAAAEKMAQLVAAQPGFRGVHWAGDLKGSEITISYWADDASAAAWRNHPEHAQIQKEGRGAWLQSYDLMIADIYRGHKWRR